MELNYDINSDGSISNVRFEGLDGYERAATVKQALNALKVQNPAIVFTKEVKCGTYDNISDAEYQQMLNIVERISRLWCYAEDRPAGKHMQQDMNVLMLLANALEMIGQMHAQLQQLPPGTIHPTTNGV